MRDDIRGATAPISYALTIAIVTILVIGLITAATGHVSDQRERTAEAQMDVVAQHVAGSLEAADRLVRSHPADNPNAMTIERELQGQIQNTGYSVEITDSEVIVSSPLTNQDVSVAYHMDPDTDLDTPTTVRGGKVLISWDHSSEILEVENV